MFMISSVRISMVYTDQSEEAAALVDLVENGAKLLRAVDLALREITLSGKCTLSELCCVYILSLKR